MRSILFLSASPPSRPGASHARAHDYTLTIKDHRFTPEE